MHACKSKVANFSRKRTGGLWASMSAPGNGEKAVLLELREMTNNESNEVREKSFAQILSFAPNVRVYIHDLACVVYNKDWIRGRNVKCLLDKFHSRNHTRAVCKGMLNPERNALMLEEAGCGNTSCCERLWRQLNSHLSVRYMSKARFRAYLRHVAIQINSSRLPSPQSH